METRPRPQTLPTVPAPDDGAVEEFFDTVRKEQLRFLDAVAQARTRLGASSSQLAQASAIHGRLARQFFDAQRSILRRRAEVDAQIARVLSGAADDQPVHLGDAPTTRQEIAALTGVLVRTKADAEQLAAVLDAAFEPDDLDGTAAERELASMLDDWWATENESGRSIVADARARAAVRRHLAALVLVEGVSRADSGAPHAAPLAPGFSQHLLSALDAAEVDDLESTLASLACSLDACNAVVWGPPTTRSVATTPVEPSATELPIISFEAAAGGDPWSQFWERGLLPDRESLTARGR